MRAGGASSRASGWSCAMPTTAARSASSAKPATAWSAARPAEGRRLPGADRWHEELQSRTDAPRPRRLVMDPARILDVAQVDSIPESSAQQQAPQPPDTRAVVCRAGVPASQVAVAADLA